jgi:hypothetical protein
MACRVQLEAGGERRRESVCGDMELCAGVECGEMRGSESESEVRVK